VTCLQAQEHRARPVETKWQRTDSGVHYEHGRWKNRRAALRDHRLVERILGRYGVRPSSGGILDVPCGTGRLCYLLFSYGVPYVGVDISSAMLDRATAFSPGRLARATAGGLPFPDGAFDVVVCCRLLHHLHDREELAAVVGELVRVSGRLVVGSFWDRASFHAWRRRLGLHATKGPSRRTSISKAELRGVIADAGADVLSFHHSCRFVSQQTFFVASKRG
jgi:SAM-dependent methyltransferase